jgi:hypothetical protein
LKEEGFMKMLSNKFKEMDSKLKSYSSLYGQMLIWKMNRKIKNLKKFPDAQRKIFSNRNLA